MPPALARERVDPPSFANLCVPARRMSVRDQAGVPLRPEILCELTRLSVAVGTVMTCTGSERHSTTSDTSMLPRIALLYGQMSCAACTTFVAVS